jgi:hypothetical protein
MGLFGLAYELFNEWYDNPPHNKTELRYEKVSKSIVSVNSYNIKAGEKIAGSEVNICVFPLDFCEKLKYLK